ncbi:PD-(D/E)XK nuclease family protein [Halorussus salinus]|uniref:PD-(D/E)XK nuclease family protein n=1 Tax=Halorussus salinus TaxID=1364935 RepID=UPI001092065B|nr:PD-(D/E)XK nuclease family protein [Halorussus salinus]
MSDDATADDVVTAAEIATHLECPRKYEFDHERPLSPPKTNRNRREEHRRKLLRDSIIAGLRLDTESPDERAETARERFAELSGSSHSSVLVAEQARYDREAVGAAIDAYFHGDGQEHGERLVAADVTLGYERGGIRYETTVDAVTKTDRGHLAIEYRPTMQGILHVSWNKDDNVQDFIEEKKFYPQQIGSFVRAAIAICGLTAEYDLTRKHDFACISLLENSRPAYETGDEIHVNPESRRFRSAYQDERDDLDKLVADRAAALLGDETDPRDWQFEEITDRSCSYCAYQNACPDVLESELSFTDRHRAADESPGQTLSHESSSEESQ